MYKTFNISYRQYQAQKKTTRANGMFEGRIKTTRLSTTLKYTCPQMHTSICVY